MQLAKKFGQMVERFLERASSFCLLFSGVMILLIGVAVSYAATRRYLFDSPEPYSYEMSMILSVACAAFAISAVQWLRRNIRVDFVVNYFPQAVQAILADIVGPILGLFYVVIVTWQSWRAGWYSLQVGEISQSIWAVPLWPMKLLVPIGFGLLCLVLIAQLCRGVISLKERTAKMRQ